MQKDKSGIYRRGNYWLDFERGGDGEPVSPNLYVYWYDSSRGRIRRKSARTSDVRLASDALDHLYLTAHRPDAREQEGYTVIRAMIDYHLEHGSTRTSADSIRARLLLFTRFVESETAEGRIPEPFLVSHLDDRLLDRFRIWGLSDPIVARRKNEAGEWERSGQSRKRSASTVEESVIQLKAALAHAKHCKRILDLPSLAHKTRSAVTPVRSDRLSIAAIGELLDYSTRGGGRYEYPERLIAFRRYIVAAVATVGRPDAVLDISTKAERAQWQRDFNLIALNPSGRIQTKKFRPVLPVADVFGQWLAETDEWFVCSHTRRDVEGEETLIQRRVKSVRSAWDTARQELGLPAGWGVKILRHSMATILANRRVSAVELRIVMGHDPIGGSSESYVIFDPSYLQSFHATVNDIFAELGVLAPGALVPPPRSSAHGAASTRDPR